MGNISNDEHIELPTRGTMPTIQLVLRVMNIEGRQQKLFHAASPLPRSHGLMQQTPRPYKHDTRQGPHPLVSLPVSSLRQPQQDLISELARFIVWMPPE